MEHHEIPINRKEKKPKELEYEDIFCQSILRRRMSESEQTTPFGSPINNNNLLKDEFGNGLCYEDIFGQSMVRQRLESESSECSDVPLHPPHVPKMSMLQKVKNLLK